jgi:aminopeptidase
MPDQRIEQLADLLVNYSVSVKPGDRVIIQGDTLAEHLLLSLKEKVLLARGHPFLMPNFSDDDLVFYSFATDDQLKYVHEPLKQIMETYDVLISVAASDNTKNLSGIDPHKIVLRRQSQGGIMKVFFERAAKGEVRWTTTLFPTQAYAQDAEMSLPDYEDFVYGACMPDPEDPIGYWKNISLKQQKIIKWLDGKHTVRVKCPETDLKLSIKGRTFINCDCKNNVPDGEIFTGPVENSVQGTVYFSYPAIHLGREITGIRLWFEDGIVVKASADKGEDYLQKVLETDEGVRRVGEFAIGTNEGIQQFTRQILFDEKIAGSFHMALGKGYPESGSKNDSAIHWDMICDLRDGGEIWVDDELLYKNGKFILEL